MSHISLVTLGVEDLARATRFYEALGWSRSSASVEGEVSFLSGGTVVLGLFGRDALAADARVDVAPTGYGNISLATNVGSEGDVDVLLGTAAEAGGRIVKPAERTDWGGYSGYFADPDGHLWEVAHNPFWPLDDEGRVTLPD